jgi:hypothetical protein
MSNTYDSGSARSDGNLLSDIVGAGGGHSGTSEEGNGDNGETHVDYY